MKINRTIFLFLLVCFFSSCTTTNYYKGNSDIHGVVYDKNKNPVSDYELILISDKYDGLYKTITDISGKFYFGSIGSGKYKLKGSGKYHENYEAEIIISSKSQYIIVNTLSFEELCCELEKDLFAKNIVQCENKIFRLEKLKVDRELIFMYKVLLNYIKEDYEFLKKELEEKVKSKKCNYVFFEILEIVNKILL